MLYYVILTERECADPQEERAMAVIRHKSIEWLIEQYNNKVFLYVFRCDNNTTTHLFLDCDNHFKLHQLLDADPLISYSTVSIEPLITPIESATALEKYLQKDILTSKELSELEFNNRDIDSEAQYYMAYKEVKPFNPLLSIESQDKIHLNTLVSQKAHGDDRELVDFNPVGKPVGILIIKADNLEEVVAHVKNCDVYIDTSVEYAKLLTLKKALLESTLTLNKYNIGYFTGPLN